MSYYVMLLFVKLTKCYVDQLGIYAIKSINTVNIWKNTTDLIKILL